MGAGSQCGAHSGTTVPTVSVIDSDAGVRQGLRSLLQTLGLEVATFRSAEEFLGGLDGWAPDCVITELELPGMSGMDLQIRLREMNLKLPVILLATFAEVPTAVRCMRLGAADFIEKPFVGRSVLERVKQVLNLPEGGLVSPTPRRA